MTTLKMLSWNVNGLRAVHKKGSLELLLRSGPDILCLQETKARADQLPSDLKEMPGYCCYYSSGDKKGYGGVGLLSRKEPLQISNSLGIEGFEDEGRAIVADYRSFILFNVYFPNGKASKERLQYKLEFYDNFLDLVVRLKSEGKNVVICGDVNTAHKEIDLARPKQNEKVSGFLPVERAWMDRLVEHGFLDTFRIFNADGGNYSWWDLKTKARERAWMDRLVEHGFLDTFRIFNADGGNYSWWDLKTKARERNVGWRIDYFFVSDNLKDRVKAAFILKDIMGSDHCPVGIELGV